MITVELTEKEAVALEQAGDATTPSAIRDNIFLPLIVSGMSREKASLVAGELTDAAMSARAKIAEATRYEIKVVAS
jgi:hypothetical protein